MQKVADIQIPTPEGNVSIDLFSGTSIVFIGANGAGKTRLGVFIDEKLSDRHIEVHRIAAHRSLALNTNIVPPSFEVATNRLRFGTETGDTYNVKKLHRFGRRPETILLSDFDHVLAALYAENNDVSITYRQFRIANPTDNSAPPKANIDRLKEIWESVLPHLELIILGQDINTKSRQASDTKYSASEMSDGERVIFYLIAQSLLAAPDAVLIFDEPELHINKSILTSLWDAIETARSDCVFIYITHDVEFAVSRRAATKYALNYYVKEPSQLFEIVLIPEDTEMPEDVVARIVGSRRPILFVEGEQGSLDASILRRVYRDFTVIPVGNCDNVIHSVASFAARPELHRIGCAGIIDADSRENEEVVYLENKGVYCLPVSEIENLLLLPRVFVAVGKVLNFTDEEIAEKMESFIEHVLDRAKLDLDGICVRHTRRRIDAEVKKIGLSAKSVADLVAEFSAATSSVDPETIFDDFKAKLGSAIDARDYSEVLARYDNKGLLAHAAKLLGFSQKDFEEFVGRALRSESFHDLDSALLDCLPHVTPRP